ncbi:MAG: molybdopterin molybdotransferase MoeA [Chloroflexota bacterium]|nr:molybdopterin molybdotransferase MoeA [Chloroflexota bacterium]MDE2898393.1 molybdopterin molybdotransferase MoeA [Chloroflexota bacterium]
MTTDIFFQIVTPDEALARLYDRMAAAPRSQRIGLNDAAGRVTAAPINSPEDSPAFARSAMDGYAVRAADTYGATEALPAFLTVDGEVPMGAAATRPVQPGTAQLIHTGGMLPPQADAVVMVEYTQPVDETSVEVLRPAAPGQHVIQAGEDLAAGDELLPAGHQLRAQDLGVLAALGITEVDAASRPVVGVLSSGDEIVPVDAAPAPGQVRDVNATTLTALARQAGAEVREFGVAPDDRTELDRLTREALRASDLVVISAGSSVSTRDMTADVIAGLGQPGVLAHGIAVKPGKPTIVALADGKPVFGLPGNPVSAMVVFGLVVAPTIRRLLGARPADEPPRRRARLTRSLASQTGRIDFVPAALQQRDGEWWATPVLGPSNLVATLVRASGLIRIPLDAGGLPEGAWVDVEPF